MQKLFNNKEVRDLAFIAIAIFMAILICITSIGSENMFGTIVSIVLLALLCVGLGYQYCKNEDNVFGAIEKAERPKAEKAKEAPKIPTVDLSKLGLGVKKPEEKNVENES